MTQALWSDYLEWNTALADHFFGGASAHRPVYLDVEDYVLASIGQRLDAGGTPDFSEAVAATLQWGRGRVFERHHAAYVQWQEGGGGSPPPTIGLLCFFTVAAEQMHTDGRLASHNYFGRLCAIVGIDTADERAKEKLKRDYRAQAPGFWSGLNRWLLAAGGSYGLPTAYSFDRRIHVGMPISQALVRAADRVHLRDMFRAHGMRPHQRIARDDMVELLEAWQPQAPTSLQRLLKDTAIREHVAEIATVELEAWDGHRRHGRGPGTDEVGDSPLVLVASYRQGMWRRLELDIAVFGETEGTWSVPTEATGPAADAARSAGGSFVALPRDGWTTFRADAQVSMPDVLKGALQLECGGVELWRSARRVVVLTADDDLPWLVEQQRAELWEDTWLLVHESVASEVDTRLHRIARIGFRRIEAGALPGVPEGWCFYDRVQITASPPDLESGPDDLLPLVPLSASQVAVAGGYSLGGHGTFHSSAAPEARVAEGGGRDANLSLLTEFLYGGTAEPRELGPVKDAEVYQLDTLDLQEGNYRLLLSDAGGRALTSATFQLRGAEHPLKPAPWLTEWMGHIVGPSGIDWFGTRGPEEPSTGWLRGAEGRGLVKLSDEIDLANQAGFVPHTLGAHASGLEDDSGPLRATRAHTDTDMPCPPHRMLLPPTDMQGRMPRRFKGHCRICGLEKWYRRSGRRNRSSPKTTVVPTPRFVLPPLPSVTEELSVGTDTLLDAVSTVGAGSGASFQRLVRRVDDAPWASAEYARTLTSLGHIEVVHGGDPGRVSGWAVLPPALVRAASSDNSAFLVGVRRPSLLALLRETADILEAQVTCTPQPEAPQLVTLNVRDPEDLDLIAAEAGVALLPSPSATLLRACPPLDEIATTARITAPPGGAQVSRYDPTLGKWEPVAGIAGDGSYRFDTRPTRYLINHRRRWFEVDNLLAKYAAGALQGVASLAYDGETRIVCVPLGARLPGLFERAVVLCSGHAPMATGDGRVAYFEVPADVAGLLWSKLGSVEWQER